MANFNIRNVTSIQHGVQSRNIILTGRKHNPASFCGCSVYGKMNCSPNAFEKGERFYRIRYRVMILPPNEEGYRRPIYRTHKWRPACFTNIVTISSEVFHMKWELTENNKTKERQARKDERAAIKAAKGPAKIGRPRLNLTGDQRHTRTNLQKKKHLYTIRWEEARAKKDYVRVEKLYNQIKLIDTMLSAQDGNKEIWTHDPLFDPAKAGEV